MRWSKTNFVQEAYQPQLLMKASTKSKNLYLSSIEWSKWGLEIINGTWKGSIQIILKDDSDLSRVSSNCVRNILNLLANDCRVKASKEILSKSNNDRKYIIIGDETWIYAYDRVTSEPKKSLKKLFKQKRKRRRCYSLISQGTYL